MRGASSTVFAVILCGFLVVSLGSCSRERYVADVVGIKKISAGEFIERYTKYRELGSPRDNILLREKILNNMINELLIFEDCTRKGYDSDRVYQERMKDASLQALLDAYAKYVSVDTVKVSERELMDEFRTYSSKVKVRYVYARTEAEAWELKKRLERGESYDVLARETFEDPDLAKNGGSLGFISYGETEPAFEEAAYSIAPGAISDPVKIKIGYAVINVEQRVQVPLASEIDFAKQKPKLEETIRGRKMRRLIAATADRIAQELQPKFEDAALVQALQLWPSFFGEGPDQSSLENRPQLPQEVASLPLVRFREEAWTIGEFLQRAEQTSEKQRRHVRTTDDVRDVATGLAIRSILIERARKAGLESDQRVRDQVKKVREDYLLRRWGNSVQDTVGHSGWNEALLLKYFNENKEQYAAPMLVNVAEIITRSEADAVAALARLKRGARFAEVARTHSVRTWSARQGGELGYGTIQQYGVLGKKFFDAKIGQLIGPESLPPYFGVFKILDKKPGRERTFEEARADVIQTLLPGRKKVAFAAAVESLRARAHFSIDMKELGNVVIPSQ